jgi:hypothetical protein
MSLHLRKANRFSRSPIRWGLALGVLFWFTATADATSIAIAQFFGQWRETLVACTEADQSVALQFSHDGTGDYASVGSAKCKLKFNGVRKIEFEIAAKDQCLKSGFPKHYFGKYSTNLGGGAQVFGHMILTNLSGEKIELLNCEVHKPL